MTNEKVFNFSPGPATLPPSVLKKAQDEFLSYNNTGMSVMEMSHRGKDFLNIYNEAVSLLKNLMNIPDEYEILFLHGGATMQFSAVALNLMAQYQAAAYVDSGNFAYLAGKEAEKYGLVHWLASSKDQNYSYIPEVNVPQNAPYDYVHITTNNTIYGTRYIALPQCDPIPLVADASSNILSEEIDVSAFGAIYAGAQKNIGPSGLGVLIVKKSLLGNAHPLCPTLLDWQVQSKSQSMYNTPNTFAIYIAKLGFQWLKELGGVKAIEAMNIEKANLLYDFLDNSRFFVGTAAKKFRSLMNVTFTTPTAESDSAFVAAAAANGLVNLKGHRLVGGMRASIYNAMPLEGVEKLVAFMKKYELNQ